jgi:hypothetical protein
LLLLEKRTVGGMELLRDVSRGKVWLLVPLVHRAAVFVAFHGLAHVGSRATKRRLIAASSVADPDPGSVAFLTPGSQTHTVYLRAY